MTGPLRRSRPAGELLEIFSEVAESRVWIAPDSPSLSLLLWLADKEEINNKWRRFLIRPRITKFVRRACIIHIRETIASNELWLGTLRWLLVYNGICAQGGGPRPISGDGIKQRKPGQGQHITGRVIQFTGIPSPSHDCFSVSNSSRSVQPRWLRNWTEDEPNSYRLLANHGVV